MSSSNQVRVTLIPESTYGETPGAGDFETFRFTSESLSGTPETTESQTIRADRLSSGQVVTGLTVGGDMNFELAKEDIIDECIESAMFSTFATSAPVAADLDFDKSARTLDRAAGSYISDGVVVGDVLTLTGFTATQNNSQVMVTEVVSATQLKIAFKDDFVTESSSGNTFEIADKIDVGTTKKSFSIEKAFLDLTTKAINYRGMIVSAWNLAVQFGEIITSTFSFSGNDQQTVDQAADFITDGRTINSPATTNSMNGSIDMPFVVESSSGTLEPATFCIQGVNTALNNNLTPQTCIGQAAPTDYSEGTAGIDVSLTAYLEDEDWNLLSKKITQDAFAVGFLVKNAGGFYGFYLPAIQVSFDDPAAAGINQDVLLNMSGVAKVGPNGEKSLTVYKG